MEINNQRLLIRAALLGVFVFLLTLVLVQQSSAEAPPPLDLQAFGFATVAQDVVDENAVLIANCRYGTTGGPSTTITDLGVGWWYLFNEPNWKYDLPENNAEYAHVIKTFQKKDANGNYLPEWYPIVPMDDWLADLIRNNPGDKWILGNEVDRGPAPGVNDPSLFGMFPDMYAVAYHDLYYFIKGIDPTAQVIVSGLVEVTPGRLQYWDMVWDAYLAKYGEPMPVDAWNMHLYIFPEVVPNGTPNNIAGIAMGSDVSLAIKGSGGHQSNCPLPGSTNDPKANVYCYSEHDDMRIFAEQVVAMRQWMKDHGQRNKPLILSEYSILYWYQIHSDGHCSLQDEFGNCFTPDRVETFMTASFDYMNNAKDASLGYPLDDNKLVQTWNWFTIRSKDEAPADLWRNGYTQVGQAFKNHVRNEPTYVNLITESASGKVASWQSGGTATAELSVTFRNNGNVAVDQPFSVTFYKDAAMTQPIGSTTVNPLVRGCALDPQTATIAWSGLTPGNYPFWAQVDSQDDIDENPGNGDNKIAGQLVVEDVPVYTLDLQIVSHGVGQGGTVNATPTGPGYLAATEVTLTAVAKTGWKFNNYDGDLQSGNPVAKLKMNSDKVVKVHFTQDQYDLTIQKSGQGKVIRDPQKSTFVYGEKVKLTAEPDEGWQFSRWEGDIESNNPSLLLTITGNTTVKVIFEKIPGPSDQVINLPVILSPEN